jgi:hypothetical protein
MPCSTVFLSKQGKSLADRLRELQGSKNPISQKIAEPPRSSRIPLASLVPGEWIFHGSQKIFHVGEKIPFQTKHGAISLESWVHPNYEGLSVVTKENLALEISPGKSIFIDTETTGLSGGTGTVAFLIGCMVCEEEGFLLHQFFMEDYASEPLLLESLGTLLTGKRFLMTFNGKSYDQELLQTRFRMHRMRDPFGKLVHLDLLHAARRLWKDIVPDCRLTTLEQNLLGVQRKEDIAGNKIPQTYFDYLGKKDPFLVAPVFKHNRVDLLSLVGLTAKINDLASFRHGLADEKISIGKIFYDLKECHKALEWIEEIVSDSGCGRDDFSVQKFYSVLLKQVGRSEEAVDIWERLIEKQSLFDLFPYEELAKYYEHREKSLEKALAVTEQALSRLTRQKKLISKPGDPTTLLWNHRRNRLLRKLGGRS